VSFENILGAADYTEGWEPPVYGWLLLDAILAWTSYDYKKSLILAAMAAETMAEAILQREYERLLGGDRPNTRMRFVEQGTSTAARELRDPVYSALIETQGSPKMKRLLHEAALYVLGRSLLIERQGLYDQIVRLYKTRNEILHGGGARYDTGGFFAHYRDVKNALRAVIDLCDWLGGPAGFALDDTPLLLDGWPAEKPTSKPPLPDAG